jgi:hypothetical protein
MERDTEINYLMGIHHNILESKKLQEKILRTIKIDIQIGVIPILTLSNPWLPSRGVRWT